MRMRALGFLVVALLLTVGVARADLWINVHDPSGSTYGKVLFVDPANNCTRQTYGGILIKCTDKGSLTLAWAVEERAARDATCVLSVWPSGTRPLPLTWHMDLGKNERGMCAAKWANDNTIDVNVVALPDYDLTIVAPPNGDRGLSVITANGCRNRDTGDRRVRCTRAGTVTAQWYAAPSKPESCTVSITWWPWPLNGLAPFPVTSHLCRLQKVDKTHGNLIVKFDPTGKS